MPRKKIPLAVIDAAYAHNAFKPRVIERSDRSEGKKGLSRVMYVENKTDGEARIGRVTFSKSRSTLYYLGHAFRSLKGDGFKANFYEIGTGEFFWISGPKKNGADRHYGNEFLLR